MKKNKEKRSVLNCLAYLNLEFFLKEKSVLDKYSEPLAAGVHAESMKNAAFSPSRYEIMCLFLIAEYFWRRCAEQLDAVVGVLVGWPTRWINSWNFHYIW